MSDYERGFKAGVEASLRAAKGSDWTRNGVCDAIRALAAPREDEHARESPAIVAAVEKFIQREDAHAARTHTVLGADGVVRTWAERVADVEARAALPLCPACAGLGVCQSCAGTGRDDGRRHAAWVEVGKEAARDATCSCACGLGVCAGCDGTGRA